MGRRRLTTYTSALIGASLLLLTSCKEQTEIDGYTAVPAIEILSVTPTTVEAFNDSINIIIEYRDLDGDVGQQNPDDFPLRVKDSRTPGSDFYHVPPITPDLKEARTKGTFNLVLPSLFLLGNDNRETTVFSIQLTDRAGNVSNEVTTPNITIQETN